MSDSYLEQILCFGKDVQVGRFFKLCKNVQETPNLYCPALSEHKYCNNRHNREVIIYLNKEDLNQYRRESDSK